MNQSSDDKLKHVPRRVVVGWSIGLLSSAVLIGFAEWDRWNSFESSDTVDRAFDMLFSFNVDSTPFAVLFLLLPIFWFARRDVFQRTPRGVLQSQRWLSETPESAEAGARLRAIVLAVLVGCTALVMCVRVARFESSGDPERPLYFGDLPPAFHDEYSYLFQARTFEAGRWSFPSHPEVPRIFDQMHVLNEGQFASRYFPGTGLWMAPFVSGSNPHLGHWIASVIACVCVFAIGRELACNGVGLLAGLLAAVSPGIGLFANLLLAHQPTLAALGVFIYGFLRLHRAGLFPDAESRPPLLVSFLLALLSGTGLAFAMLCRPMTAAGIGLPFGVWLAVWLAQKCRTGRWLAVSVATAFALPLAAGATLLLQQNQAITGDEWRSPYQLYTDLFTPSHMYGFNNVERGELLQTDRVLHNYDQWAQNLDGALALSNAQNRLIASCQWTLGIVPLLLAGCVVLFSGRRIQDGRWWLIIAAIGSLHLAHVPYWFDGIMHWHYVFESSVLWCLLVAGSTLLLFRWFRAQQRHWMPLWWMAVLLAAVAVNHIVVPPFWGHSRLAAGVGEVSFSRLRFHQFHQLIERGIDDTPALVLIDHDDSDRHIDYVSNSPDLSDPILFGRMPADVRTPYSYRETLRIVARAFPDRALYVAAAPRAGQPWLLRRER